MKAIALIVLTMINFCTQNFDIDNPNFSEFLKWKVRVTFKFSCALRYLINLIFDNKIHRFHTGEIWQFLH